VAPPKNSCSSEQEFFYPLRKQWHIINSGIAVVASHHTEGVYQNPILNNVQR